MTSEYSTGTNTGSNAEKLLANSKISIHNAAPVTMEFILDEAKSMWSYCRKYILFHYQA